MFHPAKHIRSAWCLRNSRSDTRPSRYILSVSVFVCCEIIQWRHGTTTRRHRAAELAESEPFPIWTVPPPIPIVTPMPLRSITPAARRGSLSFTSHYSLLPFLWKTNPFYSISCFIDSIVMGRRWSFYSFSTAKVVWDSCTFHGWKWYLLNNQGRSWTIEALIRELEWDVKGWGGNFSVCLMHMNGNCDTNRRGDG